MINLGQLDPDWQFATRHGKASMIGVPSIYAQYSNGNTPICPCCYQFIFKQPVPLCVNSKQLQFLGFGFPLFYSFVKNCIVLLILLICSYSAISLKKAYDTNYEWCYNESTSVHTHRLLASTSLTSAPTCSTFMIQLARIQNQVSSQQDILRIVSFVLQLLFLIYMRDHITKLQYYYDQRNTSLSDYSIMLKNIPKQTQIQTKLKQFFQQAFAKPHQIKQITLLPQYPQIIQLQNDRLKVIGQLRNAYNNQQFTQQDTINQQNLMKLEQAISDEVMLTKQQGLKDQIQCEKVILVFNSDQQKTQVLEQFQKMSVAVKGQFLGVGSQHITIKQAPQPKQILWQNVNVGKKKKLMLYFLGWGLSCVTLIIVTIVFYFVLQEKSLNLINAVNVLQTHPQQTAYQTQYNGAVALVYISLILVMLFNKIIMATLFQKFTDMQKHQTSSKFQFSFGFKYLLGLFFTTALMTLAVQAIRFHNYYSHPYGVIQEESIMFFLNAFFTPLVWLVNPFLISKWISRFFKFGKKGLTQGQANFIMEKPHYNIGKRYAEIIQTIWFTFLYSTLIPLGAIISLAGICIYYWVDKYTLLRKSSLGGEVSGKIVIPYMKLLDVTLILKPIGQLMFDLQIRHNPNQTASIVMIAIAFLYLILPLNRMINLFNPEMFKLEQKTYDEVKQTFKDTYHTLHPVYKVIAAGKLKKKLTNIGLKFAHSINTTQNLIQNTVGDLVGQNSIRKQSSSANRIQLLSDRKSSQAQLKKNKRKLTYSPRKRQHNPNI